MIIYLVILAFLIGNFVQLNKDFNNYTVLLNLKSVSVKRNNNICKINSIFYFDKVYVLYLKNHNQLYERT